MKVISTGPVKFADPIGLGPELSLYLTVFAETGCSVLLILGLFTRLATIPLMIVMLVVILIVQWQAPFGKIELPLIFLMGFVVIAAFGPGRYALDARRHRI
jgi:putative oxidoreductase